MATATGKKFTPLTIGLAMVAGLGLILMIIALSIGVIEGANADSTSIGLLFAAGLALFIAGCGAWFGVTQPYKHFDDINVPMYTGHHDTHDAHAEKPADEDEDHATPSAH